MDVRSVIGTASRATRASVSPCERGANMAVKTKAARSGSRGSKPRKKTKRRAHRVCSTRVLSLMVSYTQAEEGGFNVEVLGSDGAVTQGDTLEDARANA